MPLARQEDASVDAQGDPTITLTGQDMIYLDGAAVLQLCPQYSGQVSSFLALNPEEELSEGFTAAPNSADSAPVSAPTVTEGTTPATTPPTTTPPTTLPAGAPGQGGVSGQEGFSPGAGDGGASYGDIPPRCQGSGAPGSLVDRTSTQSAGLLLAEGPSSWGQQ